MKHQFTRQIGGPMLGLLMLIGLGFAFDNTAQGQSMDDPRFNKDSRNSDTLNAQAYREREMRELNNRFPRVPRDEFPVRRYDTWQARVLVNNQSTREISSVTWVVSFTDPGTGALLATRDVTTKKRIASGKQKTIKKDVSIPRVLRATPAGNNRVRFIAPILTSKVVSVTYADGTTSTNP